MRKALILAAAVVIGISTIGSDAWAGKRQQRLEARQHSNSVEIVVGNAQRNRHRGQGYSQRYMRDYCMPPRRIMRRLRRRQGWNIFAVVRRTPNFFVAKAFRGNGRKFRLKVDSCTGEIIHARRMNRGRFRAMFRRYF